MIYYSIELLRAIATLLITNSHLDGVYPRDISWGGCPGVSLFFAISGFLLISSIEQNKLLKWWIKKVIRLYIPLTIVNVITVLIGFRKNSLLLYLFPVHISLWYIPVISVLYVVYYLVVKFDKARENKQTKIVYVGYRWLTILLVVGAYIITYAIRFRTEFFVEPEILFRAYYGLIAMLMGSIIFDKKGSIKKSRGNLYIFLSIASCACFLISKLLMNKFYFLLRIQFITQVFGVGFAIFALMAGLCFERKIEEFMKGKFGNIVHEISKCSLEIYIVQFAIIKYLKRIIFPLNLILIIIVIMIVAEIIHFISGKIYSKMFA